MKLLELTRLYYPSVGGMEKFVHDRCRIYETLGIEYKILATTFSTEKRDPSINAGRATYLKQFTPYNITPSLSRYLSDEYDVISINLLGRFYSDYAIHHYAKKRQKIILTPYFDYHTNRLSFVKRAFERFLFPRLLKSIDAIIAFTKYERHYWVKKYGVAREKIHVISPYVETRMLSSGAHSRVEKYFLYLGRVGANKRIDLLLTAFLNLKELRYSLYVTVREDDIPAEMQAAVTNDARIKLLGNITEAEKRILLEGAEALIFPTTWESFGYVAFEAASCSKPLLCSDIPVLRELHTDKGVLFFPNTVKGMENALNEFVLYTDMEKSEMGTANRNNALNYSFENAAGKYQVLFSSL